MTDEERSKLTREYLEKLSEAIEAERKACGTGDVDFYLKAVRKVASIEVEAQELGLDVKQPRILSPLGPLKPGEGAYLAEKFESPPGEFDMDFEEWKVKKIA